MNLFQHLLRLGHKEPDLRDNLTPILDHLSGRSKKADGGWQLSVKNTSLKEARQYTTRVLQENGMSLDEELPEFDRNYLLLQDKVDEAMGVARINMPVIEPEEISEFQEDLADGSVDIFQPWAKGTFYAPDDFPSQDRGEKWIELGYRDGDKGDDVVNARMTNIQARDLKPAQSQIWFDKLIHNVVKYGAVQKGSRVLDLTIIASKDGFLLDGHHRWSGTLLSDPSLKVNTLYVPLSIEVLLDIGRSYGAAMGNEPKQ